MVLTVTLAMAYDGVGFVLAGKAIARLPNREPTKCYLPGIFTSLAWAVFWGTIGNVLTSCFMARKGQTAPEIPSRTL